MGKAGPAVFFVNRIERGNELGHVRLVFDTGGIVGVLHLEHLILKRKVERETIFQLHRAGRVEFHDVRIIGGRRRFRVRKYSTLRLLLLTKPPARSMDGTDNISKSAHKTTPTLFMVPSSS